MVRWCADGDFLRNFCVLFFSVSRLQQISDLHSKFTLRPHRVWKYGRHPISGPEIRRGKKRKKKVSTAVKFNGLPVTMGSHNYSTTVCLVIKIHSWESLTTRNKTVILAVSLLLIKLLAVKIDYKSCNIMLN